MYRSNRLKKRLLNGERTLGSWLILNAADIAEVMAHAGFDALVIDHEHTPQSPAGAVAAMRAAAAAPVTMLVRAPGNDPLYLKRILDAGIEGVMMPMIETADEAASFVAACHYPPDGMRGVSYPTVRASTYGYDAAAYLANYKDDLLLIAQVETAAGVANIGRIAAVEGLDMIFIGIGDLSASIGRIGQFDDKKLQAMMARAERAVLTRNKLLGGIAFNEAMALAMFERGYHFVLVTSDLALLREGATRTAASLRKKLKKIK